MKTLQELFTHENPLTGNLAKVQVLERLASLLENTPAQDVLKVLDVGCGDLNLWYGSSIISKYGYKLDLYCTDIDSNKLKQANNIIAKQKWNDIVKVRSVSVYELSKVFTSETFDVVVSTQVLEHLKNVKKALVEIYKVLKRGGDSLLYR